MLFSAKTGLSQTKSKTPQKSPTVFSSTVRQTKKEVPKGDGKEKSGMKENPGMKYKTKDSFLILQSLEDIYS